MMETVVQVFVELKKDGDVMEAIMKQQTHASLIVETESFKVLKFVMMRTLKMGMVVMLTVLK